MATISVVGFSLSGVAAALELAASGHRIEICEPGDEAQLREAFRIDLPTASGMHGAPAEELLRGRLREQGIPHRYPARLSVGPDEPLLRLSDHFHGPTNTDAVVLAPNGSVPIPDALRQHALFGRGLSSSVDSDFSFFEEAPVILLGNGPWAIEQSMRIVGRCHSLTLVLNGPAPERTSPWIADLEGRENFSLLTSTAVIGLEERGSLLAGVRVSSGGQENVLPCSGAFLAYDPMAEPTLLKALAGHPDVVFSGLARGIPYFEHARLWEDGILAARRLLKSLG